MRKTSEVTHSVKRGYLQIAAGGAVVLSLSLLYFFWPATRFGFYPKCIFHAATGLDCPGCGSQRAASELLHGHLLAALSYNLLFVLALPLLGWSALVFIKNIFKNQPAKKGLFYTPWFAKTVLVTVVCFWVARNIPVNPFTWLKA